MNRYAAPMTRLIDELRKLPGVGTRTAQRFAFHILRSSNADADALADSIRALKAALRLCSICNNITDVDPCLYCASPTRNQRLICVVEEPTNIAAIEKTRSYNGVYHVLHGTLSPVNGIGPDQLRLTNLWPRLAQLATDPGAPHLGEMWDRTTDNPGAPSSTNPGAPSSTNPGAPSSTNPGAPSSTNLGAPSSPAVLSPAKVGLHDTELILATSPTVEGEATARYLADEAHRNFPALTITRIATGVPAGSDIEYADEVTMTRALENRRIL